MWYYICSVRQSLCHELWNHRCVVCFSFSVSFYGLYLSIPTVLNEGDFAPSRDILQFLKTFFIVTCVCMCVCILLASND